MDNNTIAEALNYLQTGQLDNVREILNLERMYNMLCENEKNVQKSFELYMKYPVNKKIYYANVDNKLIFSNGYSIFEVTPSFIIPNSITELPFVSEEKELLISVLKGVRQHIKKLSKVELMYDNNDDKMVIARSNTEDAKFNLHQVKALRELVGMYDLMMNDEKDYRILTSRTDFKSGYVLGLKNNRS